MSEFELIGKRKKKLRLSKTKATRGKYKKQPRRQQQEDNVDESRQQKPEKRKIQLTQEFEENEKEVMTLLENTSLLSESSNNSQRDKDNKSPNEIFFCGTGNIKDTNSAIEEVSKQTESIISDDSVDEERVSNVYSDGVATTPRSAQPTLAATFIQIEPEDYNSLVRLEKTLHKNQHEDLLYKPRYEVETTLSSFSVTEKLDRNTILLMNRFIMEFKSRKQKVDKNILNVLKNHQKFSNFYKDHLLYKSYCEFKFKPIFIEPSLESLVIPSRKLLTLQLKDLHFTEHPLLQEEHRLANNLELLYEHRQQRLQEKLTEKLYADLQIERNILNELLSSAENSFRNAKAVNKEKKAAKIEQHLFKVKALREKLYDEELTNKQLLQEILNSWKQLKNLRQEQEQQFTRLMLRIKLEDLTSKERKQRQKFWQQRFETDLNEIYREHLEEYYRNKRLWQQHKKGEDYVCKPRKPNIDVLSSDLRQKHNKCFLNPKEPRIDIVRILANASDFIDMPGPRKLQTYFMRVFFDQQMVGETRCYRLERDLSLGINENLGIMLNRRLPKDIRIKLYKKSRISSAQKIANIIVPLPLLSHNMQPETAQSLTITFSSHKQPISGYLRLKLQSDKQFYPTELIGQLFPAPQQHITIPKSLLHDWCERKLFNVQEAKQPALMDNTKADTDTDDDTEKPEVANTCTFEEDILRFCDPSELDSSRRLTILRSRYQKNDARTRDLKFIPMLEHELEFDWETEEAVLDPGNWMDPIDLHKHEGKKYLRNLYKAIQNQCASLTKVQESRENLLLNDEPISWRAFFQTIKLIFQPSLNLYPDKNLSPTTSVSSLSLTYRQEFKIICNIIRATGIPVRISNADDNYSRDHTNPESSNVFLMQNLKYSNVRPFIAVSYKDKFGRTMTAEGSNPTWNEQLILQLSGCLSDLQDDLRISLYDEVVENQLADDPALKTADIYQRIQNNWLGELRIPINAILAQQKMDGAFELNSPKILIGYKRPSLENISTGAETTTVMIEQFPEIKDSVMLWCYLSLEPLLELPTVNTKCLECSELIEVRQYLNEWSLMAKEIKLQQFMTPLLGTSDGKLVCCTRLLQAIAPPIEASENLLESACRFVSLLATPKYYEPCLKLSGVWLNNQLLLDTTWGSPKDKGVLLCNYLLNLGLQSSLVLGTAHCYGECTFVLYTSEEGEMFFIDPGTGKRYSLKDVFCPLQTIKMVITQNNFYLNIQAESRVSMMNFNWNDSSCWLAGFNKKNPAPLGGFQNLTYKYFAAYNTAELKSNIERKIMKKISSWRNMRKTIWNRAFQPRLLKILQNMEQSVTFGAGSFYEELKYNNILAAEFPNFKLFGFTLNFSYTNLNQISERIKTTGIHLNSNRNVEFSLAVHLHPYPNNIISVWLFLLTIVPL